jgi:hypothetical protein
MRKTVVRQKTKKVLEKISDDNGSNDSFSKRFMGE